MNRDRRPALVRWSLLVVASLTLAALMLLSTMASAQTQTHTKYLIHWLASDWQYRLRADGVFVHGPAAFGSGGGCPLQSTVMTNWPTDTSIAIRNGFRLPADATNVQILVAIDNDARVFVNGTEITDGWYIHENCPERGSLTLTVPDSLLRFGGGNMIQVRGRDRGAESYLDAAVTADVP